MSGFHHLVVEGVVAHSAFNSASFGCLAKGLFGRIARATLQKHHDPYIPDKWFCFATVCVLLRTLLQSSLL